MTKLFAIGFGVLTFFGLLVLEVIGAMLVYIYLASNHTETFGELVRISRDVLNTLVDTMDATLPALSNNAYATLVGELGPKSILLLLIGLVMSGLVRLIVWAVAHARGRLAA